MTDNEAKAVGVGYLVVAAEVINRMAAIGIPINKVQQLLDKPNNEIWIIYEDVGYHIVPQVSVLESRYEAHAIPGRFVHTQAGKLWKDGAVSLHDKIRARNMAKDERNEGIIVQ